MQFLGTTGITIGREVPCTGAARRPDQRVFAVAPGYHVPRILEPLGTVVAQAHERHTASLTSNSTGAIAQNGRALGGLVFGGKSGWMYPDYPTVTIQAK
jgi:hypothetical protein